MSTDTNKPRMGRINLPVPMHLKSLAVKAAHESGMNLETWVAEALERQAKDTLLEKAWKRLIDQLYQELRVHPLAKVTERQFLELQRWSPWYQPAEGPGFGFRVQERLRNLGMETTFEWVEKPGDIPFLLLRRIPLSNPPPGFQILFGQLPQPTSNTVTVQIKGGPYDRAKFEIAPFDDGIHQFVYSATGGYKLTSLSSNVDQKWEAEFEFVARAANSQTVPT